MSELSRPTRLPVSDLLALGLVGLRTRKLRAALSALGISIGIATMIVVTGIPASSHQALRVELSALGTNLLTVQPVPEQDPPVLLPTESLDMVRRIGPVTATSAVANTHATVRRSDRVPANDFSGLSVLAARPDLLQVVGASMSSGRFFGPADEQFPTAVLGFAAATRLGLGQASPGGPPAQIYVNRRWFSVIGVLAPVPLAGDLDQAVLIAWPSAQALLKFDGHPTVLYVRAREAALEDARAVLAATAFPARPGQVTVSRPSDALAAKRATENSFSSLFLSLAGVSLLVGGIGVANTMFISVLERRREIGLRRALGASRGHIRGQFLTESVVLSGLGGVAGTALGVLATLGYATVQGWPVVIPLSSMATGCLGALVVGVLAGVYPSVRASRLTPTEALSAAV